MQKQPSGLYHQKLKIVFLLLAAVVTLVLASVSGILLTQRSEENYETSISVSRTILEEKSAVSLKEISNTMTDIVNDSLIKEWSVSEGTRDFYLLSSRAQKALLNTQALWKHAFRCIFCSTTDRQILMTTHIPVSCPLRVLSLSLNF